MCLAAVYRQDEDQDVLLFQNIANVTPKADELQFVDLMGRRTEFRGQIQKIDLLESKIFVK